MIAFRNPVGCIADGGIEKIKMITNLQISIALGRHVSKYGRKAHRFAPRTCATSRPNLKP